jgi:N-acetylmuramoyl-L-alanine amidase
VGIRLQSVFVALCGIAIGALAALGSRPARAEPPVRLERVSVERQAQDTVLTLALSGPVAARLFGLHSPERLVIDLPDTRRRAALPAPPAGAAVLRLRAGYPQPHRLRLVLDLAHPLHWQSQRCAGSGRCLLHIALGADGALAAATFPVPPPATPAAASGSESAAMPDAAPSADLRAQQAPLPARGAVRARAAAHAPPAGERPVIVAVDAGHGGMDPGATGAGGTREKEVTMAIARALAARIDGESGLHAVLTRDGDHFVPLRDRMERAAAAHADMFVSIHADAIRDRDVSGASVYILSERGASSEAARMLAEHENAADLKGGIALSEQSPDLRPLLLNLSQSASIGASGEAADRVLGALDGVGAVRKREVQQAAFVVLKSPDIPSLLVETAYISNPAEERLLRTPAQQQRLAGAIFSGIERYFQEHPPEGSPFAHGHERSAAAEIARNDP